MIFSRAWVGRFWFTRDPFLGRLLTSSDLDYAFYTTQHEYYTLMSRDTPLEMLSSSDCGALRLRNCIVSVNQKNKFRTYAVGHAICVKSIIYNP